MRTGSGDEQRSWRTAHRGVLWIHAGLEVDEPAGLDLPRGVILGHVMLLDCVRDGDQWAWLLDCPVPLAVPVKARGHLWLWNPAPLLSGSEGSGAGQR